MKIYLDNNATTGLDPKVLEAMLPALSPTPSNPSSVHFFGKQARAQLSSARESIANYLNVKPGEIIFTSGATESLNTLLRGVRGHIITSNIEHSAVFNTLKYQETLGSIVTYLPAGTWGAVKPQAIQEAITPATSCIVLSAVNSETGVKIDLEAIAHIAKQANIPFIVDAVAMMGKEPFTLCDGISALAFSAHKFHGPKGVGATFIRSSFKLPPLLTGGDQEQGKRAGTENLPGIIGMAAAIELLKDTQDFEKMCQLRDYFEEGLKKIFPSLQINGEGPRVANTSNICFTGLDGETLLMALDMAGICVSHGSACASGALEPSRVLLTMGFSRAHARSSLRFSLSRWTTQSEINKTLETIKSLIK